MRKRDEEGEECWRGENGGRKEGAAFMNYLVLFYDRPRIR